MSKVSRNNLKQQEDYQKIWNWTHQLPKVALHRHLEGALRLRTLLEIAQDHHIEIPSHDPEKFRPHVQMTHQDPPDFHRYLEKFKLLRYFYTSKDVIQRVTREAILDAAEDNIRYLELRFNPVALAQAQNFSLAEVVEWVMEATDTVQTEANVRTCLIMLINREEPLSSAEEIVDLAIAYKGPLIRAIDLAGDETQYPPELFRNPFKRAHEAGLRITVHAGEAMGPESVRNAINILGAERIGHGIRSLESSDVAQMVYDQNITLEVCPTSNLQTGVVRWIAIHPLADLLRLRLRATINTDNPSVSDTTLTQEYVLAMQAIGLDKSQIYQALKNALNAAFIPEAERPTLKAQFCKWLTPYPNAVEILNSTSFPQNKESQSYDK